MRFTIERLRTVLLVSGAILIVALGASLAFRTWKNPFKKIDVPKRLGIDITQEANGVTYKHTFGSHSVFQIHASKVTQLKNSHALLHDVKIELYEQDGSRVDRIQGDEFEYDQQTQVAKAAGPVEITMMRPQRPGGVKPAGKASPASDGSDEIHVKTSGLVFDQKTGVASTDQRVDFVTMRGAGSAVGALYDSAQGHLVLDHQVELIVKRSAETVLFHAEHAEFDRDDMICHLRAAAASFRNGDATTGQAKILFRDDGTAVRLDAANGFAMATATGGHLAAPTGWLEFDEDNQPRRGHLEGGVTLDSVSHTDRGDRASHGVSPAADLDFADNGQLRHAHLERGVELISEERNRVQAETQRVNRTWRSPVADVEFRDAGNSQVEPASLHGTECVVITGETQRGNGAALPSRVNADDVRVEFGPNSTMTSLAGSGHAGIEETTATGTRQSSSGDRLEAHFAQPGASQSAAANGAPRGASQIELATLDGHVVMDQVPAAKPGIEAQPGLHALAGRADYEGAGEWIHLTQSPRVDDGRLQLTADKIDVSQGSGDAFAHGDVKATWLNLAESAPGQPSRSARANAASGAFGLGGQTPAHVIADEAQLHQATGEATFHEHVRLWQDTNSVAAPVIVLNRQKQTLTATGADPGAPVRLVFVSAAATGKEAGREDKTRPHSPAVIRASGGALRYSEAERKARIDAGAQGSVIAETPTARSVSDRIDLVLLPPGNHAGRDGSAAQVDSMTASGHVQVTSQGRRGSGTKLVYTEETGQYVLTGTPDAPPRMTDPQRGNVTGEALIFNSRDDSVSIEGGGSKTASETRTPK